MFWSLGMVVEDPLDMVLLDWANAGPADKAYMADANRSRFMTAPRIGNVPSIS